MSTPRARVVVGNDHAEVALLERRVLGLRYWEVPGGHVEPGETLLQAALREIHEELGIALDSQPVHHTATVRVHHLYTADVPGRPTLRMSGPEVGRGRVGNTYRPRWVPRAQVRRLLLWPLDVRAVVVRTLRTPAG